MKNVQDLLDTELDHAAWQRQSHASTCEALVMPHHRSGGRRPPTKEGRARRWETRELGRRDRRLRQSVDEPSPLRAELLSLAAGNTQFTVCFPFQDKPRGAVVVIKPLDNHTRGG